MINAFEHNNIKTEQLPIAWQTEGALEQLERFLQYSWEQKYIFYLDKQITRKQQFIDFDKKDGIKLKNYIGTIIYKGEQLNVFPKVFKHNGYDNDTNKLEINDLVNNIVIWLSYCNKSDFPFVSMNCELSDTENLLELFITIYIHYVKIAIDRQPYFQYEEVTETGSYVKGKIDFNDYATKKYPSGIHNKLNYAYSNFSFDNIVNRIIKCTCLMIMKIIKQYNNKNILCNIIMKLRDVSTINCTPYDCDSVHLSDLHKNYKIIINMSKMFLFNKVNSYDMGIKEFFCLLFPAEKLFESFISGFLVDMLNGKAKVTTQSSNQCLATIVVDDKVMGNAFFLREDILVETDKAIIVIDTKYKEIDRFENFDNSKKLGISDDDIKQMAIYAIRRGAKKLFLIYPLHKSEKPETIKIQYDILLDKDDTLHKVPLEILKVPFVFDKNTTDITKLLIPILSNII